MRKVGIVGEGGASAEKRGMKGEVQEQEARGADNGAMKSYRMVRCDEEGENEGA